MRGELCHRVILFIKDGNVDMLVANVRYFERFFEQAAATLRQSNTTGQLVLDHLQVFLGLDGFPLLLLHAHHL